MGDKTPERKGLLWWIEHENTNEAWTMKNPWAVGAIVLTILIVLCMLATFFWGLPRPVANVIVNVAFCGYWGVGGADSYLDSGLRRQPQPPPAVVYRIVDGPAALPEGL